jgi:hypothetical protein
LAVLQVNPMMAVADVLDDSADLSGNTSFSPFTPMQALLRERQNKSPLQSDTALEANIGGGGRIVEPPRPRPRQLGWDRPPFFVYSLLAFSGLSAGALWLASRRLSVPKAAP